MSKVLSGLLSLLATASLVFAQPRIEYVTPDEAQRNQSLTVNIVGAETNFHSEQGSDYIGAYFRLMQESDMTQYIYGRNLQFVSRTELNADFQIPSDAMLGYWDVVVESSWEDAAILWSGFHIYYVNHPPSSFPLILPPDGSRIPSDELVCFLWSAARDQDGQDVTYTLNITGSLDSRTYTAGNDVTLNVLREDLIALLSDNCLTWEVWASDGEESTRCESPFTLLPPSGVSNSIRVPADFGLSVYPNPFNAATQLDFGLCEGGDVNLVVYDLNGRLVENLVSGHRAAGVHSVSWVANGQPSGLYLARLECGRQTASRKLMLVK